MSTRNVRRCSHLKTNGIQCGAPALRGQNFCHYHRQAYMDFPLRQIPAKPAPIPALNLGLMDDPDGIHHALVHIVYGVVNGTLNDKAAGRALYALQIMSANFKQTSFQRQLDSEFSKSNLNAYQLWDKMERESEEEKQRLLYEKRVAELKRLERTCCKCKKDHEPKDMTPELPPAPELRDPLQDPDQDEPVTLYNINASADARPLSSEEIVSCGDGAVPRPSSAGLQSGRALSATSQNSPQRLRLR